MSVKLSGCLLGFGRALRLLGGEGGASVLVRWRSETKRGWAAEARCAAGSRFGEGEVDADLSGRGSWGLETEEGAGQWGSRRLVVFSWPRRISSLGGWALGRADGRGAGHGGLASPCRVWVSHKGADPGGGPFPTVRATGGGTGPRLSMLPGDP